MGRGVFNRKFLRRTILFSSTFFCSDKSAHLIRLNQGVQDPMPEFPKGPSWASFHLSAIPGMGQAGFVDDSETKSMVDLCADFLSSISRLSAC